jgi:hypothetical protein
MIQGTSFHRPLAGAIEAKTFTLYGLTQHMGPGEFEPETLEGDHFHFSLQS